MTRTEHLERAAAWLSFNGIEAPRREVEELLAWILGVSRLTLLAHGEEPLTSAQGARFWEAVDRRAHREPLQYITGEVSFCGLRLAVTPGVFIPRPETELLVEAIVDQSDPQATLHFLDLGTGSGAIALALCHRLPRAVGVAVDVSREALAVAAQNAIQLDFAERLRLLFGDLRALEATALPLSSFDVIVSNPPYVPQEEYVRLAPEVARWEPRTALDGGVDGLWAYRAIARQAPLFLKPDGRVAVELGAGEAEPVQALFVQAGFTSGTLIADFAGIQRLYITRRP
ncbi:MAG: peptide chain release factor N(5)-glutamine methyltransferase [Firmicutes bacterium]|nr:peptide chain release factor N(5)-glutamine methyltransferase [Bacillota bacterium]